MTILNSLKIEVVNSFFCGRSKLMEIRVSPKGADYKISNPFNAIRLLGKIHAVIHGQLIFAAAKLGIADLLSEGSKSIEELAKSTGTIEERLYRVLRVLVSLGIFAESPVGHFRLTELAEPLRADSPDSVRDVAIMLGSVWHLRAWANIIYCLEHREAAFEGEYKTSFFNYLKGSPEDAAIFNSTMTTTSKKQALAICRAYDFPDSGTIVDVGGGHGYLLSHILKSRPDLRGVLFDSPAVVEGARSFLESEGLMRRCLIEEGSFFEKVPQGGDVYLLKHILHDYDDDKALEILRNCYRVMTPNDRILVIDIVFPEGNSSFLESWMDVEMMVLLNGKERTKIELQDLFSRAGFRLNKIIKTRSQDSIVEGIVDTAV